MWILRMTRSEIPTRFIVLARPAAGFSFVFLSVFMCVHPWFQKAVQAPPRDTHVLTGIDVLEWQRCTPLAGKRDGLITNQTGINRNRRSTIELLGHAPGVTLLALFGLEQGIHSPV